LVLALETNKMKETIKYILIGVTISASIFLLFFAFYNFTNAQESALEPISVEDSSIGNQLFSLSLAPPKFKDGKPTAPDGFGITFGDRTYVAKSFIFNDQGTCITIDERKIICGSFEISYL